MRAWIRRSGADVDLSPFPWENIPGHLGSAEWVDGVGDVADVCSVTVHAVPDADVDKLLSTQLELLLAPPAADGLSSLLCYGPYDVEPASVTGEAAAWTLSGRIGAHVEAAIADSEDEEELYANLETAIRTTLAGSEPWRGWAGYDVGPTFIWDQARSQLFRAENLAGVRQILAQWGLTAVPYAASVTPTGHTPRIRVEPIYRPSVIFTVAPGLLATLNALDTPNAFAEATAANALDLSDDHLDAYPSVTFHDGLNRRGDYRRRQIRGVHSLFGETGPDHVVLSAGTLRPPVPIPPDNWPGLSKVREEIERWKLQNEAATLTAVRRFYPKYTDAARAFVTPLQLVTLGTEQLPAPSLPTVWQVRQVDHAWDGEEGYRQTIKASLWQGSFWRTSGAAVKGLTL